MGTGGSVLGAPAGRGARRTVAARSRSAKLERPRCRPWEMVVAAGSDNSVSSSSPWSNAVRTGSGSRARSGCTSSDRSGRGINVDRACRMLGACSMMGASRPAASNNTPSSIPSTAASDDTTESSEGRVVPFSHARTVPGDRPISSATREVVRPSRSRFWRTSPAKSLSDTTSRIVGLGNQSCFMGHATCVMRRTSCVEGYVELDSPAEASERLVGSAVFKTVGGPKRPRRVRFPSASAKARRSGYFTPGVRTRRSRPSPWGAPGRDRGAGDSSGARAGRVCACVVAAA